MLVLSSRTLRKVGKVKRSAPPPLPIITPQLYEGLLAYLRQDVDSVLVTELHAEEMRVAFFYDKAADVYVSRYQFKGHPFVDAKTPILLDMIEEIRDRAPVLFGTLHARFCA